MAYMYCPKCDQPQDPPTARQVLEADWSCWSCERSLIPGAPGVDDRTIMLHLLERIENIETTLNVTPVSTTL